MKICKECESGDWLDGNHFGKPFFYYVCMPCWDNMTEKRRKKYIKDGIVPITTSFINDDWREYCAKFGMTP